MNTTKIGTASCRSILSLFAFLVTALLLFSRSGHAEQIATDLVERAGTCGPLSEQAASRAYPGWILGWRFLPDRSTQSELAFLVRMNQNGGEGGVLVVLRTVDCSLVSMNSLWSE